MIKDKITNLVAEFKQKQQELQEQIRSSMQEAFTDFFDAYPTINNINFIGYVPYFNDGDECTFRLGEILFTTSPELSDSPYESGFYPGYRDYHFTYECSDKDLPEGDGQFIQEVAGLPLAKKKIVFDDFNAVQNFITGIQDFIQAVCGSHVRVKIDREGIHVDEYDDHE